jgi:hypothetical protein
MGMARQGGEASTLLWTELRSGRALLDRAGRASYCERAGLRRCATGSEGVLWGGEGWPGVSAFIGPGRRTARLGGPCPWRGLWWCFFAEGVPGRLGGLGRV